jgi:DNA (cytosine-5)-methyltransferase 1
VRIRTLDLFCGGGGSSWGAQAAGAEIVCGVDAWDLAVRAYASNFPHAKAVHLRMTPESGPSDIGEIGEIDLLLSSPECTHHTCARGSRPQDEDSKQTAFYVTNFARDLSPRPRWVVIENVVHMRGWHGYEPLLTELRRLGYRTTVYVLDASRFGVPQARRRVFVVGDLTTQPPAEVRGNRGRAPATLERANRGIAALGEGTPFLVVYYGSDGAGGWQPLNRPLRTITTLDRFGLVTWRGTTPMLRMLQVDELMAAMGFRDGYNLEGLGQRRDRIRLLGNGVCPPVMAAIVESLTRGAAHTASREADEDEEVSGNSSEPLFLAAAE